MTRKTHTPAIQTDVMPLTDPMQQYTVDIPVQTLKDRFMARSIPLETDFWNLIDVADCGRKAAGLSPDVVPVQDTGLTLDSTTGQLKVKPTSNEGIQVSATGIGVITNAAKGITVGTDGLKITDGFRVVPVGTIMLWPASTLPSGWLLCDGNSYKKSDFPILAALFGNTDDFSIPDFRNNYPVGCGTESSTTVCSTLDARTGMPDGMNISISSDGNHAHTLSIRQSDSLSAASAQSFIHERSNAYTMSTSSDGLHTHSATPHSSYTTLQTRPKSITMNFIIAHD